jgi:hypothetical protein
MERLAIEDGGHGITADEPTATATNYRVAWHAP